MDRRYIQANTPNWFSSFDESKMLATIDELEIDGELKEDIKVVCYFEVCGTCNGKGTHVNPAVDSNGITGDEWNRDWSYEGQQDYLNGLYDVTCYECDGKRVVPEPSEHMNKRDIVRAIQDQRERDSYEARDEIRALEMGY